MSLRALGLAVNRDGSSHKREDTVLSVDQALGHPFDIHHLCEVESLCSKT